MCLRVALDLLLVVVVISVSPLHARTLATVIAAAHHVAQVVLLTVLAN